jgi:hypothetical protein
MAKILLIALSILLLSSCAVTTRPTVQTMDILNQRLSSIEREINKKPPQSRDVKYSRRRELNKAQKEFIEFMMDYLGE